MNEDLPECFSLTIERKAAAILFDETLISGSYPGNVKLSVYRKVNGLRVSFFIEDTFEPAHIKIEDLPLIEGTSSLIGKYAAIYQTKLSKEPL